MKDNYVNGLLFSFNKYDIKSQWKTTYTNVAWQSVMPLSYSTVVYNPQENMWYMTNYICKQIFL
jgi:hypothetical protein